MHRVQAGTQLFRKLRSRAGETFIFSLRSKSIFPGGQKTMFRARRPPLFGSERTKSNMSLRTRNIVQCKCENARKLHTYVIFVLSKTEKKCMMHHIIRRKTHEKRRSKNAKNLDVSRETLIFRVQQDVVEHSFFCHGCSIADAKTHESCIRMPLSCFPRPKQIPHTPHHPSKTQKRNGNCNFSVF